MSHKSKFFAAVVSFSTVLMFVACEKKADTAEGHNDTSKTVKVANKAVEEEVKKEVQQAASQPVKAVTAEVFFKNLKNGATVKSPLHIEFGVKGMAVTPAGQKLEDTHAGHHHIIVDGNFIENSKIVPKDERHIHFGGGQTEAELTLKPGKHSLTLQFANGTHKSYGKVLSKTIQITVE